MDLNLASYHVLAAEGPGPLAKDEGCPSLLAVGSGQRSAEEKHLSLLATSRHVAIAPAPTDGQGLMTPGLPAYLLCLLCSSTTYLMGSNASVT